MPLTAAEQALLLFLANNASLVNKLAGSAVLAVEEQPTISVLTGNAALYIATTGNDSSAGTQAAPLRTLQAAANIIQSRYNLNNFGVTIHAAPASYPNTYAPATFYGPVQGFGPNSFVTVVGLGSDAVFTSPPGQASITAGPGANIQVGAGVVVTGNVGVRALAGGTLTVAGGFTAAPCANAQILSRGGSITISGAINILGGGTSGACISTEALGTVTLSPGVQMAFSQASDYKMAFALADSGQIDFSAGGFGFTGTAVGPRYRATANGVIRTGGAAQNYLPGSTPGTLGPGGLYL